MIKDLIRFKDNKMGSLSVEFAGVFFIYCALMYCIYDTYNSIMLQNKLERVTYSVASIFRERSALYPLINDDNRGRGQRDKDFSLCKMEGLSIYNSQPCFKSYELINKSQVEEAQKLATKLLNKDVAVRIDALFVVATNVDRDKDVNGIIYDPTIIGTKKGFSARVCPNNSCGDDTPIGHYFDNLSDITDDSIATKDYFKLVPQAKRSSGFNNLLYWNSSEDSGSLALYKRWIPLYRVNMCVINEESLYLKLFDSTREEKAMLPNLCHEVVVISRCNDLESPRIGCPLYHAFLQHDRGI